MRLGRSLDSALCKLQENVFSFERAPVAKL